MRTHLLDSKDKTGKVFLRENSWKIKGTKESQKPKTYWTYIMQL